MSRSISSGRKVRQAGHHAPTRWWASTRSPSVWTVVPGIRRKWAGEQQATSPAVPPSSRARLGLPRGHRNICRRAAFPYMSSFLTPGGRDWTGPDELAESVALQVFVKALTEAVGDTSEDLSVRMVELLGQLEQVPYQRRSR